MEFPLAPYCEIFRPIGPKILSKACGSPRFVGRRDSWATLPADFAYWMTNYDEDRESV
jgi:hypothetical protein